MPAGSSACVGARWFASIPVGRAWVGVCWASIGYMGHRSCVTRAPRSPPSTHAGSALVPGAPARLLSGCQDPTAAGARALRTLPTVIERPSHGSVVVDVSKLKVMTRHDRTLLHLHEVGALGRARPPASRRPDHELRRVQPADALPEGRPGRIGAARQEGRLLTLTHEGRAGSVCLR